MNVAKNKIILNVTSFQEEFFNLLHRDVFDITTVSDVVNIGVPTAIINVNNTYGGILTTDMDIDMRREHDLDIIRRIRRYGIMTPVSYASSVPISLLSVMKKKKKYIIKGFLAARSLSKGRVTKDIYPDMLTDAAELDNETFNKTYNIDPGNNRTEEEKYLLKQDIKECDFLLQEWTNVKHEYRVLYFDGTDLRSSIVIKRVGYAPNSKKERKQERVDPTELMAHDEMSDGKFMEKVWKLGREHPSPTLSFDVYVDNKGRLGLFEYSVQWGLRCHRTKIDVSEQATKAMLLKVNHFLPTGSIINTL